MATHSGDTLGCFAVRVEAFLLRIHTVNSKSTGIEARSVTLAIVDLFAGVKIGAKLIVPWLQEQLKTAI